MYRPKNSPKTICLNVGELIDELSKHDRDIPVSIDCDEESLVVSKWFNSQDYNDKSEPILVIQNESEDY